MTREQIEQAAKEYNKGIFFEEGYITCAEKRQQEVDFIKKQLNDAVESFLGSDKARQDQINELVEAMKRIKELFTFSSHVRPPEIKRIIDKILEKYKQF